MSHAKNGRFVGNAWYHYGFKICAIREKVEAYQKSNDLDEWLACQRIGCI